MSRLHIQLVVILMILLVAGAVIAGPKTMPPVCQAFVVEADYAVDQYRYGWDLGYTNARNGLPYGGVRFATQWALSGYNDAYAHWESEH